MPKKTPPSTSTGTTANPVAQPPANPAASAPAAPVVPATTGAVTPKQPGAAKAKAKPTAGPAPTPATNADNIPSEAALLAQLEGMLNIGSPAQPQGQAGDETPVAPGHPAEDQTNTGEDFAEVATEATGDNPANEEEVSPETDTEDEDQTANANADDADEDDEDDAELEGAERKLWPKSYRRRITKLTRKVEALESERTELQALREENERLKTQGTEATATQSQANGHPALTPEEQKASAEVERLEALLDEIDENPDGLTTPDGNGGHREWTALELRKARRIYERQLDDAEDALRDMRKARKAQVSQIETALPERHPWLKDRTHQGTLAVDALLRKYPVLREIGEARLFIADAVAYELLRRKIAAKSGNGNGHANGNGNGQDAPKPAPRPAARPGAQPAALNARAAHLADQEKRFLESQDPDAGTELLKSILYS